MKVFLVEDSAVIRDRLKRLLEEIPQVQITGETGDAQEAITAILEQRPEVVLLDIHLLNGSGIDVLQRVKQEQAALAVIVLTDYPYPEYRQLCLDAGADFFLIKSTEFEQVVPALQELTRRGSCSSPVENLSPEAKMEILEIQSSHSLLTSRPDSRPVGAHVYQVNCRQFTSTYKSWLKDGATRGQALAVMTVGFERIWMTPEEAEQVAAAIRSTHSPLALG